MTEINKEDSISNVYEIGYHLISSVPAEKVEGVVASLKAILSGKGAIMIAEETAELVDLAYTMTKKIGTAHQRFDQAYFGWMKFELAVSEIESVKKAFEMNPDMLRMLVIITIKENTFLGKKAPVVEGSLISTEAIVGTENQQIPGLEGAAPVPATVEDMDKSIDEMVKGA
jgi:ribosomal protein S6